MSQREKLRLEEDQRGGSTWSLSPGPGCNATGGRSGSPLTAQLVSGVKALGSSLHLKY